MTHVDNVDQCILLNDLRHISSITKPKGDGFFLCCNKAPKRRDSNIGSRSSFSVYLGFLYIFGIFVPGIIRHPVRLLII